MPLLETQQGNKGPALTGGLVGASLGGQLGQGAKEILREHEATRIGRYFKGKPLRRVGLGVALATGGFLGGLKAGGKIGKQKGSYGVAAPGSSNSLVGGQEKRASDAFIEAYESKRKSSRDPLARAGVGGIAGGLLGAGIDAKSYGKKVKEALEKSERISGHYAGKAREASKSKLSLLLPSARKRIAMLIGRSGKALLAGKGRIQSLKVPKKGLIGGLAGGALLGGLTRRRDEAR